MSKETKQTTESKTTATEQTDATTTKSKTKAQTKAKEQTDATTTKSKTKSKTKARTKAPKQTKARNWCGVLYPENMVPDWKERIAQKVQLPYVYCQHDSYTDADGKEHKTHVHMIICFNNATTYNNALNLFNALAVDGKRACNTCEVVHNVKNVYDYFIHDTDAARADGKTPYPPEARICGNGFDINDYVQASPADRKRAKNELVHLTLTEGYTTYSEFMRAVIERGDPIEFDVAQTNCSLFANLTRGNYLECTRH